MNKNDRVLDLGCEDGTLLYELKKKGCSKLVGVEIDNKKVFESINKGLEVINLDINKNEIGTIVDTHYNINADCGDFIKLITF